MDEKSNQRNEAKPREYSVKTFLMARILLGSIGRNILASLLITSLTTIFILFVTNTSQGTDLSFIYVLLTILALFFAALLVTQVSYRRHELRRIKRLKQLLKSEERLFLDLRQDIRSLLEDRQRQ